MRSVKYQPWLCTMKIVHDNQLRLEAGKQKVFNLDVDLLFSQHFWARLLCTIKVKSQVGWSTPRNFIFFNDKSYSLATSEAWRAFQLKKLVKLIYFWFNTIKKGLSPITVQRFINLNFNSNKLLLLKSGSLLSPSLKSFELRKVKIMRVWSHFCRKM